MAWLGSRLEHIYSLSPSIPAVWSCRCQLRIGISGNSKTKHERTKQKKSLGLWFSVLASRRFCCVVTGTWVVFVVVVALYLFFLFLVAKHKITHLGTLLLALCQTAHGEAIACFSFAVCLFVQVASSHGHA